MTKIISNTEITSYNTCTKQHDFMYNLEIEPRVYPLHIRRGYAGHAALEAFYKEMKERSPVGLCKLAMFDVIDKEMAQVAKSADFEHVEMLTHLRWLLDAYAEYYWPEQFRVVEVEKLFTAHMKDDIYFGMYLDILVEFIAGPSRGNLAILDTKIVNNFKSHDEMLLDGQLPKYLKTVRENGYPITRALFNQIRHRKMKSPSMEDLFRRIPSVGISNKTVNNIWLEQTDVAVEIHTNPAKPRRIMSPMICRNCFFLKPCQAELNSQPTDRMLEIEFKPRERPLKNWAINNGQL